MRRLNESNMLKSFSFSAKPTKVILKSVIWTVLKATVISPLYSYMKIDGTKVYIRPPILKFHFSNPPSESNTIEKWMLSHFAETSFFVTRLLFKSADCKIAGSFSFHQTNKWHLGRNQMNPFHLMFSCVLCAVSWCCQFSTLKRIKLECCSSYEYGWGILKHPHVMYLQLISESFPGPEREHLGNTVKTLWLWMWGSALNAEPKIVS